MTVGIVDYGMGNVFSVKNTMDYLGSNCEICSDPLDLKKYEKIILPGVGSFSDCIKNLERKKFIHQLNNLVVKEKKPILGICLGMQIMATLGYEGGESKGLGWFDAEVKLIEVKNKKIKIPNIGWEEIKKNKNSLIFKNINSNLEFYFIHSYFMDCKNKNDITSFYNIENKLITASIEKENIFGTQFHPEKSEKTGLKIIDNFINL